MPKHSPNENTIQIHDAREVIAQKKAEEFRKKSNFPKIIFNDNQAVQPSRTEHKKNTNHPETRSCQTENDTNSTATQTKFSVEQQKSDDEIWVSRVDPTKTIQEEKRHNEASPTMTETRSLEASPELVTEGMVATLEKATKTTEAEEDTPLFRKKLQRVLGVRFIAAVTKKDRNLRPLKHPNSTRQPPFDPSRIDGNVGFVSIRLVSPHSQDHCTYGKKLQTLHRTW